MAVRRRGHSRHTSKKMTTTKINRRTKGQSKNVDGSSLLYPPSLAVKGLIVICAGAWYFMALGNWCSGRHGTATFTGQLVRSACQQIHMRTYVVIVGKSAMASNQMRGRRCYVCGD